MTKNVKNKSKKTKPTKNQDPFDVGIDMEQKLADLLCDRFEDNGEGEIDAAICGAFSAFSHRMLIMFKKEYVLEMLENMAGIVEEEHGKEHVCDDCAGKGLGKEPTGTTH